MARAPTIGKQAAAVTENDLEVWMRTCSPGFGVAVWTSWWENLSTMESAFARLTSDPKYFSLLAEGRGFIAEGVDDTLYQSVYDGSGDGGTAPKYVSVVEAVCATGSYERGMTTGVEIAQKAEVASGVSTGFVANVTGNYGRVGWLAGYESLGAFEEAQSKLNSDTTFVKFLDANTGCYVQDPSVTQSLVFARVS